MTEAGREGEDKESYLEGLAPYGGQTSSSCGGMVAFGHQMGALPAPWLVQLKFRTLPTSPSSSCGGLVALGHLIGYFEKSKMAAMVPGWLPKWQPIYVEVISFSSKFQPLALQTAAIWISLKIQNGHHGSKMAAKMATKR